MHSQRLDKYTELRQNYQTFFFESFEIHQNINELHVIFHFNIDNSIFFKPSFKFPKKSFYHFENLKKEDLDNLVFNIGMVELISYWKAICPKMLVIKPFHLNAKQIEFWKKIYFNGLGEFYYTNGIHENIDTFMNISCTSSIELQKIDFSNSDEEGTIIPVGGGKDSVVSLELLKETKEKNLALIMNPRGASLSTAKIAGYENQLIEINRSIDKKLIELNSEGYLNGHTPFSALLGFMTILAARLSGKKYIALSNEASANEPTIPGTNVNRQYSKSFEFEKDFREYVHEFITSEIEYFSLLRPLSELQIASLFAKNSKYFNDFKSCNAGSKEDIWCGKCSKCMFAFIILSPFIKPEVLEKIFGKNMLNEMNLIQYFDELTGIASEKPFECVGTVDEVNEALFLSKKLYEERELPKLMQYYFNSKIDIPNFSNLKHIEKQHFIKEKYLSLIVKALEK